MNAISPAEIIVELENAIAACSAERCARMLWETTDLLVASRERLHALQIDILDDVLLRLTRRIDPPALAQLSATLAELRTAPRQTLRHLASHEDPAVASPVLLKPPALSQRDLEEIAMSRGEQHLLAISGRPRADQALTDILLKRGGKNVYRALARNPGAQLSEAGYAALTTRAERDGEIAEALMLRPDTPAGVLRDLLARVPSQVKASLLDTAPAGLRERIETTVRPSGEAPVAKPPPAVDYAAARPEIVALSRTGKLNDSTVNRFAIRGETANLLTALSVLSGAPIEIIERAMADTDCEGLVMACRASRLNWSTTLTILSNRGGPRLSYGERERAQQLFETLHLSTSQWSVRWGEMAADVSSISIGRKVAKSGARP